MSNYTRWYREGSVSATSGSSVITGTGTYWKTAGLNTGDILKLEGNDYEILSVTDDTHLTIAGTYGGTSGDGMAYAVVRNFTSTMQSKVAANVAGLLEDYAKYLNTSMATIYGKSAYEIACAKGYVGTESQWLDSLIGAGKWNELDERTKVMTEAAYPEEQKNNLIRGQSLGSGISSTQIAAIRNGTYDGMWLGDYWDIACPTIGTVRARIVDFGYFRNIGHYDGNRGSYCTQYGYTSTGIKKPHVVVMFSYSDGYGLRGGGINTSYSVPMNETATTEGGFVGTKMYTETLPQVREWLLSGVGADNVLYHYAKLSNAVTDGKTSGMVDVYDNQVMIPNIAQLTGRQDIGDSSFCPFQFNYFRVLGSMNRMRSLYFCMWTRDVMSATKFGCISPYSQWNSLSANCAEQPGGWGQLVPYAVIG